MTFSSPPFSTQLDGRPVFVVGDVQGCFLELEELLRKAHFNPASHRLAFVGDLINRGPDSLSPLELAVEYEALVVAGNHEINLLNGARGDLMKRVRKQLGSELPKWLQWIQALPLFLRFEDWILVHAGFAQNRQPEECTPEQLTRIREVKKGKPWFDYWKGPETVIFGHWALRGKVDLPLVKGLDTGCVYGGHLTGLWWPEKRWVQVRARRVWYNPITQRPNW